MKGFWLRANNDSVAVIAGEPLVLDIFNKKTKAWHRVALPFPAKRVRAFGPWIATMAEEPGWLSAESEAHPLTDEERAKFKERNRGGEKRESEVIIEYRGRQEPGVTVDRFFDGQDSVFPGKLLLLNGISGALFQWSTGQADSEIVLATDEAVYYRVNDELFRAGIRGGEMEEPVRLASGPAIFQVHWAFLGPAGK